MLCFWFVFNVNDSIVRCSCRVLSHAFDMHLLVLPAYDTRCYFNVRSKADISQLNYRTEPTTKKV